MIIEAKGELNISDVEKNKKLMKKIDQLPAAEQKKWIKTYTNAYNGQIKDGIATGKAEESAAKAAWDKVPAKLLEKPGKSKKPLAAYKEAFIADTDALVKTGEKVSENVLDNFLMWMEASNLKFVAAEEEMTKEFTPEEQEFLKTVTGYTVKKTEEGFNMCLHGPEGTDGAIEIEVSSDESLEEEMEEEKEEVLEDGVV